MKEEELLPILETAFRCLLQNINYKETRAKFKRAEAEIVAILKNQPTITKKDIGCWAGEARDRVCAGMIWECIEDVMKEMLDDIGVSITVDK